jgi:predicted metal-binding membrane protein
LSGRNHPLTGAASLEFALRRDRLVIVVALLSLTVLALGYTYWLGTGFDMSGMMSPHFIPWTAAHFAFMFAMWLVMMVGMMTPSVAPTVLLYVAVGRSSVGAGQSFAPASAFVAGYLLSWTAFSAAATLLQWLLESRALITPMMAGTNRPLAGAVLVAAGVYQWLPIKQSCLSQCRAPLSFVQRHGGFQASARGSLRLGVLHGGYCIGCCWVVMALLFAFGVMNFYWIAGLMLFVLIEKVMPYAGIVSRVAGLVAIAAGIALMGTLPNS